MYKRQGLRRVGSAVSSIRCANVRMSHGHNGYTLRRCWLLSVSLEQRSFLPKILSVRIRLGCVCLGSGCFDVLLPGEFGVKCEGEIFAYTLRGTVVGPTWTGVCKKCKSYLFPVDLKAHS